MLRLVEQQDDLDPNVGQQSALLVGSDGTPPTVHWVEHIASCVVDRLSDMMVNAGLPVEEPGDSAADCVEGPPWSAVAGRAAHLVAQWEGLEASLPPTSLVPLRCCRRMPLLCTCLTGLTHCACVFPNYSEPFYQLAQFCHRQGLDLVSSTPAQRVCLPHPSPSHTVQECRQLLTGPLPEAFLLGKDQPTPPLQMKGNIFAVS